MSILLYPLTKQQKQGLGLWIAIMTLFYFFHELIFAGMEISTDDFKNRADKKEASHHFYSGDY